MLLTKASAIVKPPPLLEDPQPSDSTDPDISIIEPPPEHQCLQLKSGSSDIDDPLMSCEKVQVSGETSSLLTYSATHFIASPHGHCRHHISIITVVILLLPPHHLRVIIITII